MVNILASSIETIQIVMIIVWALVIILALVIESETAELVSIWFGVGAIPALLCAIFDVSIFIQLPVFALVSLILVFATRPLARKLNKFSTAKTNVDRLFDMIGVVVEEIPADGKGEIKIDFQNWTAVSYRNVIIPKDSKVVVKEVKGNKLIVDFIEEIEIV